MLIINISPLKKYRDFRLLFFGQLVSAMGSMITYVAVPYQVYELTKNSFLVGLLGAVQLVPVLVFGMLGGSYADRIDRRKLLLICESLMCLGTFGFVLNSLLPQPNLVLIFVLSAFLQSVSSFHRPSMEAITQKIIDPKEYGPVAALSSFRWSVCAVAGPAIGGILIAAHGVKLAYLVDFISYSAALLSLVLMRSSMAIENKSTDAPVKSILEGLKFAKNRPEIMGTYIVDIVAMTFAFPTALFPAMAENWGGAKAVGVLFSSMSVGSLFITFFSGWTSKVSRHGAAVVLSAGLWGLAIVGLGFSTNLYLAAFFLALAGALDSISAMFRHIIWSQTIPNHMRGRLAGLEMISYMSGPLAGNMRSGWAANLWGVPMAVVSGGALCVAGVLGCGFSLPQFWNYKGEKT